MDLNVDDRDSHAAQDRERELRDAADRLSGCDHSDAQHSVSASRHVEGPQRLCAFETRSNSVISHSPDVTSFRRM
jgi:hypothetical protein